MNKIYALIIFSAAILFGCNQDFLDRSSLTQIADDNFWQSENDAYLALNAVYSTLQSRNLYGGSLNGVQGLTSFDAFGDNLFGAWKWEGPGLFMEGNINPSSYQIEGLWDDSYQGISRVNRIIENLNNISEDLIPTDSKNKLLGQALFLRALLYFNLAVYYGDVPLITSPQTLSDAYVPKNTYDEISTQIVEDLKFAIANLPQSYSSDLYGYATKGAALGLLARFQLYNKNYDGDFGVLNLTQQVMGLGYSLYPDYAELFTPDHEKASEIVFSVRFLRGDNTNNGEEFSSTYNGVPKVELQPMKNLVNDYYCTDGLPISTSPLFDPNDQSKNRDPRALANFFFDGQVFNYDLNKVFKPSQTKTGYGLRKYLRLKADAEGNQPGDQGSQDFYVIRYADIILMRAEAMAETNDLAGAREMVDMIRARVNMPSVEDVEGTNLSKDEMIQVVRHERRVELAEEGLRFFDLKRWGKMEEAVARAAADPVGPYNPVYLGEKSEFFPIPQSELDVNKNLTQNQAWQ